MLTSSYKIPGGKLVKIKLEAESEIIAKVKILGDFFLHPEETIQNIEDRLVDTQLESQLIEEVITTVLKENDALLIGATSGDFATAIMMAWESK